MKFTVLPLHYLLVLILIIFVTLNGIVSFYIKSTTPFDYTRKIAFWSTIVITSIFLFLFNPQLFAWVLIISIIIERKYGSQNILKRKEHTSGESWKDVINTPLILLILVISSMTSTFHKIVNGYIQRNVPYDLLEISATLSIFFAILCLTLWAVSSIFSNFFMTTTSFNESKEKCKKPSEIENLIAKGKLKEAIKELENLISEDNDDNLDKATILLKSNLVKLEENYNLGLIDIEKYNVEFIKLSERVLSLSKNTE